MHTVAFKLNKDASQFQAGESIGFGIRCGVKCQDPKTKEEKWTNYQAVIFAKSPAQIDFYSRALVAGTMAVVSGEKISVEEFQGTNGLTINLNLLNARVEAVHTADAGQQSQQQPQRQAPQQRPQQQAPQQAAQGGAGFDAFEDDIPFN